MKTITVNSKQYTLNQSYLIDDSIYILIGLDDKMGFVFSRSAASDQVVHETYLSTACDFAINIKECCTGTITEVH